MAFPQKHVSQDTSQALGDGAASNGRAQTPFRLDERILAKRTDSENAATNRYQPEAENQILSLSMERWNEQLSRTKNLRACRLYEGYSWAADEIIEEFKVTVKTLPWDQVFVLLVELCDLWSNGEPNDTSRLEVVFSVVEDALITRLRATPQGLRAQILTQLIGCVCANANKTTFK